MGFVWDSTNFLTPPFSANHLFIAGWVAGCMVCTQARFFYLSSGRLRLLRIKFFVELPHLFHRHVFGRLVGPRSAFEFKVGIFTHPA